MKGIAQCPGTGKPHGTEGLTLHLASCWNSPATRPELEISLPVPRESFSDQLFPPHSRDYTELCDHSQPLANTRCHRTWLPEASRRMMVTKDGQRPKQLHPSKQGQSPHRCTSSTESNSNNKPGRCEVIPRPGPGTREEALTSPAANWRGPPMPGGLRPFHHETHAASSVYFETVFAYFADGIKGTSRGLAGGT